MTIQEQIQELFDKKLSHTGFKYAVTFVQNSFGGDYLKMWIACSENNIHGITGQLPQVVSLMLNLSTRELHPQIFGGNGGQCIVRMPNLNDPSEKYLAMKSVKVPFRTPKKEDPKILNAIEKFIDNYINVSKFG